MSRFTRIFITFCLLPVAFYISPSRAQQPDSLEQQVQAIIDRMTPQQRVGQLMVVTFEGTTLAEESDIVSLIADYHVGGVLLLAENDNIDGRFDTPLQVHSLTSQLQQIAFEANAGLPLLIATIHNGNDLPGTQIASETTPLPSYMALGATWEPEYATLTGQIAGQELAAMGVNMLLGPSLNIAGGDLIGVDTFGGQAEWVGEMGAAYIAGVHAGSDQRVLVIARQAPGLGTIDRPLDQEIPVLPRSLADLQNQDLRPFFSVTGSVPASDSRHTDGIQCANVRYSSSTETRPVCLDAAAFRAIFENDRYGAWREYGLVVSDALGTRAVRRWYNVQTFPHRQVARDALLAGNDLLLLAGADANQFDSAAIADTLDFFTDGYLSDPLFKARVDDALARIIRHKLALYGVQPALENIIPPPADLAEVGERTQSLFEVARRAVTLIAPNIDQLTPPPQAGDKLVIFTEERQQQQCSACPTTHLIQINALENAIRRLYGSSASGQVQDEALVSYPITDLQQYMRAFPPVSITNSEPLGASLAGDLLQADWIIFAVLDGEEAAAIIQQFLDVRDDVLGSQTKIVVLAMNTPYLLSSTDISKLSAYYGIFGHTQPFIDAAARAIFQEVPFSGALPVSLPAINYDVMQATLPDPTQNLRLTVTKEGSGGFPIRDVVMGDTLLVRTEPILDQNGHRVPERTPVTFTLHFVTEGVQVTQEAVTLGGIAQAAFTLRRAGEIEIRAASYQAETTLAFESTVAASEISLQTMIPTGIPTLGPTMTRAPATINPTEIARATQIAASLASINTGNDQIANDDPRSLVTISDFLLSLMGLLLLVIPAFSAGWATSRSLDGSIRIVLGTVVAGLTGYVYYGIGAPGAGLIEETLGELAAMLVAFISGVVGLVFTWFTVRDINTSEK